MKQNKSIPAKTRIRKNPSLASCVSAKIEEGDIRGAVRLAISDESFAPQNEETSNALKLLHPPRFSPAATEVQVENEGAVSTAESRSLEGSEIRTPPRPSVSVDASNVPPCLQLTLHDITESIKSFSPGSSCGMDGLSAQHLKDMTSPFTGTHGQRLLLKLLDFANLCLAGSVPTLVRPIVFGAKLFALSKKTGGVRPIAAGCTLRRMIAKAAVRVIKDKLKSTLEPIQLGFGVDGGAEAAAHTAGRYIHELGQGRALLKIDFSNAFNSIRRDVILDAVQREMPEILTFVRSCYEDVSLLFFGDFIINSAEGIQQGDPLGPMLFCIVTIGLAKRLKSELNIWYLDDGSLGGDIDVLIKDFETILHESQSLGLGINEQKCEIITDDSAGKLIQL